MRKSSRKASRDSTGIKTIDEILNEKISRRRAIGKGAGMAVGTVAGLVIGGAAGYFAGGAGAGQQTTTSTVNNTVTQTVTQTSTAVSTSTLTTSATSGPVVDYFVDSSLKGTTINVLAFDTIDTVNIKKFIPEFQSVTGINTVFTVGPEGDQDNKVSLLYAAKDPTYAFNYNSMDGSFIFQNAIAGNCLPLNDLLSEAPPSYAWNDYLQPLKEAATFNGQLYGMDWDCGNHWMAYRKDLFEADGIAVPQTLDDLVAAAQHFNNPAKGVYGISVFGSPDLFPFFQWDMFTWACGGTPLDANGMPTANSPENILGTQYYAELGKYAIDWANSEINKTTTNFAAGKAAMCLNFVTALAPAIDPTTSVVADKVAFAPWPKKVSWPNILTATGMSINPWSPKDQQRAAFSLMTFLTSPHVQAQAFQIGWPTVRASVVNAPQNQPDQNPSWGWMAPTIAGIVKAQPPGTSNADYVAAAPLPKTTKPGLAFQYLQIIYTNFADIVAGKATAEQALNKAQQQLVPLFK